jgi:RHS repeat-associated protein
MSMPRRIGVVFILAFVLAGTALVWPVVSARQQVASQDAARASSAGPSQTRLPDGRWLLLGGDDASGTATGRAAIVDPVTGIATPLPGTLLQPRSGHSATVLPDGSVLVAGGRSGSGLVDVPEVFDPATNVSTPLAITGSMARVLHTTTLLTDGRVLVVGGSNGGAVAPPPEIWDLQAHTATALTGSVDRAGHTAILQADGRVLVTGGRTADGPGAATSAIIDPATLTITSNETPASASATPIVSASLPSAGASDVPLNSRLVIRFSDDVRLDTLTSETIRVTGQAGALSVKVVGAENGRLAFVWPLDPLGEGETYVVTIDGAVSPGGLALARATIPFTTVAARVAADGSDDEAWLPTADSMRTGWRSDRAPSPWETLAPLMAPTGVTAISGRVLTLDGRPLPRVTLEMEGAAPAESDRTGRFLLQAPAVGAGRHVLDIKGRTANRLGRSYGFFEYGMTVVPGRTNVLSFTIWMPRLDTRHAVRIPSPTTREVVVTTPSIPGLELHIPPNTVIRGEDGKPVRELTLTPIPVDRPPFPLATNVVVPVYFTIQPGGAYVSTSGGGPKGAWLVYPNYQHEYANKRMQFYHYDPDEKDWYVYGLGTVLPNEAQVVPDPKTRLYSFTGAMITGAGNPGGPGRPPGDCCGTDGDPVNLTTGLFVQESTDLVVPDVIPIILTRTYRSQDLEPRPFGVGTIHPYAIFLWSAEQFQQADLILPDGGRIHYVRTSDGFGFADAIFTHQPGPTTTATPTEFYKSTLAWNDNGWDLTLKDGTVYVFGKEAPLQAIRDRNGNTLTITHANGQTGNITRVTSPSGRWIAFSYDGSNRVTQATDNIGRSVTYTYDAAGNLATATDPENHITSYTYDGSHRMLAVKPPNLQGTQTNLVTNEYTTSADAPTPVGWVKKQTHADGGVYQFAYTVVNGKSAQTDVTDPRGFVRRATFNSDGYTLANTRGYGQSEAQTASSGRESGTNFINSQTNTHGDLTTTTYDSLGNVRTVTRLPGTADEAITTYTYDPVWTSEVATITDPLNHTITIEYDAKGNRKSATDALNHKTLYTVNALGQVTSVTDPLQHTTLFEYSGPDLIKITDPLGRITQRFADAGGRLLSLTAPSGQISRFTYDKLNHVTEVTDSLGGVTTYGYDTPGRLGSVTDARSNLTMYEYDDFNRLANRKDPLSKTETFSYDVNGNLRQRIDRKGQTTTRGYDALNRLSQITYDDMSTIIYGYDAGNRLTTITDSLNGTITRTFDNLDRLKSETTPQGVVSYTYDAADRRASMTVAGQPAVTYGYDDANRLISVTQGTSIVTITYDDADRRSTLTLPNGIVTTYGYDNADQLTSLTYTRGQTTLGTLTYSYDLAGRRTDIGGMWARTGLPAAVPSATHDPANRLAQWAGITFSHDSNGNLASDGLTSYTWNARDQLVGLDGGTSASFTYDGLGRRSRKTVDGVTTSFLYDGANALQEIVGGVPVANRLVSLNVDEVFVRTTASGSFSTLSDVQNSLIAESDSSGSIVREAEYEPFGRTTISGGPSQNNFLYTGREWDSSAGLYYYRARYYDPMVGRFTSEDPIGFGGGNNFYAYALNSPVNLTDPSGLDALSGNIGALQNIFPGSRFDQRNNALIIPLPCRQVRPILTAQGYQDGGLFGYNGPGSAFWNPFGHAGGSEYRTLGPGFHFRMQYERTDPFAKCPDESCTLDQFHIDTHNPLEPGQLWPHIKCDFLHWCGA